GQHPRRFRKLAIKQHFGSGSALLRRGALDPLGLESEFVHLDEGNRCWGLSDSAVAGAVWLPESGECDLGLVGAGACRCVPRLHWLVINFGFGTPGTVSSDLHQTAVAQLAGQRCVHNCSLHARASSALHRELVRSFLVASLVNDSGTTARNSNGGLHCLSICPSQGAGYVAEPFVATASAGSGAAGWFRSAVAFCRARRVRPKTGNGNHHTALMDFGGYESAAWLNDLG